MKAIDLVEKIAECRRDGMPPRSMTMHVEDVEALQFDLMSGPTTVTGPGDIAHPRQPMPSGAAMMFMGLPIFPSSEEVYRGGPVFSCSLEEG